ncbi:hypothetical protein Tco_1557137, partial [Tanacetum coccineum]
TAPSVEETEPFETDESAAMPPPHPAYRMTVPEPLLVPAWSDSEVARLLAISSLPASPLSPCHREDRPEVNLPPRIGLGIALGPRYKVGESSTAAAARPAGGLRADYGFVATMDREIRLDKERYVGYGITDLRDTNEIYMMLDDEQSQRQLLAGRSADCSRQRAILDLLETDRGRREEMRELRAADRARQQQIIQTLTGQQGPAGGPAQPEMPEEAGSSS